MNDTSPPKAPRERSPSFPVFSLKVALDRLSEFEAKFGRHPAPFAKAGLAWGMEENSSQANRYLAALKAFGLIEYNGSGTQRTASISDAGRSYLLAQQQTIKDDIARDAALKPKAIARFWPSWKADRPPNEICLDELVLKHGFTKASAPQFLRVYDDTIAFAGLSDDDKVSSDAVEDNDDDDPSDEADSMQAQEPDRAAQPAPPPVSTHGGGGVQIAKDERVLTTGILAKDASFKLVVSGRVGPKELDRLIQKLELDKEILADHDDE